MKSMTGFGAATAQLDEGHLRVEIRAVNHRYLEVRTSLPSELNDQTHHLEKTLRERVERGRYDISVKTVGVARLSPQLDVARVRAAYEALRALQEELVPGQPLPVSAVLTAPDLYAIPTAPVGWVRAVLTRAFDTALADLEASRDREGEALRAELSGYLENLRTQRSQLAKDSPMRVTRHHQRLKERLKGLLEGSGAQLDESRLANEVALLADRLDVSEELGRLQIHFEQLGQLLNGPGAVGRRADFMLQEVMRETNTTAAKSQDAAFSHQVVEMKAVAERMRQQVQNVL